MKKNMINDNVIRAMAIGISAMLMTSTPMTVLAAENQDDDGADKADQVLKPSAEGVEKAQEAAAEAAESTTDAKDSAQKVKDDVKDNVSAGEVLDSEGNDLSRNVIDAADAVEDNSVPKGSSIAEAQTDIANADTQLSIAEANDELSDVAYNQADKAASDASAIASEVKDAMDKANETADSQVDQLQKAADAAEAKAAYDALKATADTAQEEFNTRLDAYNAAKNAYDEAAAKVKECEDAYNAAIANAGSNAADAQRELENAKANAAALEQAVADAKNAVDVSAADAMEIANLEELTRTDDGLNWRNEDKLFIAIMEKYYLPEVLDIQGAKVTRVQGIDNNEYNYFKAVYKDEDGNEQVKYYNFKMDKNSRDNIVIFEKRAVEIFGDPNVTPDRYVGKNGVVDVNKGLENGTIVQTEDGKYVEKNAMTSQQTLVSDSVVTGTSTRDVSVDENSKQESYKYDEETGELVKTVTADVTTVTYTGAKFTSDKTYETDAKRDAAAEAKKKELEASTGKDATITETEKTTYTYTADGTYIPTFTRTVDVNEEVERKSGKYDPGVKTEAEAVASVKKDEEKNIKQALEDDDLYCIGVQSNLAVTGYTEDKWYDDSDFKVTGTVSATYARVEKQVVSQSTFGSLWNDIKALFGMGSSTNEKLEEAARQAVESQGGIFVSANWDDLKFNKATIRYVAGVRVTTDEMQSEQAAKNAVGDAALAQAKANGATGVYNVNTVKADAVEHTTYSYTVDYLQGTSSTKNTTVATETYADASTVTGQIIQNKNYYDAMNGETDKILLTQTDSDYRAFVDNAKDTTSKYARLLSEAEQASADVVAAQDKVDSLKAQIEALKKDSNTAALKDLEEKLAVAEADKEDAKETLDEILNKLKNAGITLEEIQDRNPVVDGEDDPTDDNTQTDGNGGTSGTTDTDPKNAGDDTGISATAVNPNTATPTGTQGNTVAAIRTASANTARTSTGNVTVISDEDTPLAASADETNAVDKDEDKNKSEGKVVTIKDEETPLAASMESEEGVHMSWWWLLIVTVLGATGYEMYRKHQEKKKAAAEGGSDK